MAVWLSLAIFAYFLTAIAFVIDKYLLELQIPKPFTYAFWVAILSTPVVLLIPFFDIYIPDFFFFVVAFASGTAFFGGLIFLYKSIKASDVSVASTQVGVFTAIFTYLFSLVILKDVLPLHNAVALVLLAAGMLFLGRAGKNIIWHALAAGALLGISFVLLKWSFTNSDFINRIFWTRVGFIGSAVFSLAAKRNRDEIKKTARTSTNMSKVVFVINKLIAGMAFFLLYYAILRGNVVIVNALLGFQFLFIFLIALVLRNKLPGVRENIERGMLINKIVGIVLILAGFLAILT